MAHTSSGLLKEASIGVNLVEACTRLIYCFLIVGKI